MNGIQLRIAKVYLYFSSPLATSKLEKIGTYSLLNVLTMDPMA